MSIKVSKLPVKCKNLKAACSRGFEIQHSFVALPIASSDRIPGKRIDNNSDDFYNCVFIYLNPILMHWI